MSSNDNITQGNNERQAQSAKRPNLTNEERNAVLHFLLQRRKVEGKLQKGALAEAASNIDVSTRTCERIWDRFLETVDSNGVGGNMPPESVTVAEKSVVHRN